MLKYMSEIYPAELELKHENSKNDQQASYLDLNIQIVNNELVTSLYDKRDDFPFKIVNFPDLSGNIPHASSYGVFIAQSLRYAKACHKYDDFMDRTRMLKTQLVRQHFIEKKITKKLKKWTETSTHGKELLKYGHSVTKIIHDITTNHFHPTHTCDNMQCLNFTYSLCQ